MSSDDMFSDDFLLQCKNNGMPWKDIQAAFKNQFNQELAEGMLQMRYKRLTDKLRVWTAKEDEVLNNAVKITSTQFWKMVGQKMEEQGFPITGAVCEKRWKDEQRKEIPAVKIKPKRSLGTGLGAEEVGKKRSGEPQESYPKSRELGPSKLWTVLEFKGPGLGGLGVEELNESRPGSGAEESVPGSELWMGLEAEESEWLVSEFWAPAHLAPIS